MLAEHHRAWCGTQCRKRKFSSQRSSRIQGGNPVLFPPSCMNFCLFHSLNSVPSKIESFFFFFKTTVTCQRKPKREVVLTHCSPSRRKGVKTKQNKTKMGQNFGILLMVCVCERVSKKVPGRLGRKQGATEQVQKSQVHLCCSGWSLLFPVSAVTTQKAVGCQTCLCLYQNHLEIFNKFQRPGHTPNNQQMKLGTRVFEAPWVWEPLT